MGGVAVYGATVLGLLAVHLGTGASVKFTAISTAWMLAAGFVCLVGSVDDCFNLPSRLKLALQILSVLPIVLSKYYIGRIVAFGCPIELGWLGIPLTVLWLVGCINALNLLDGMDGLASIVGLSTAAMLGLIAASQGQYHVAMMALALAAALAGFLVYNLPPASIFLGDSGSMVIGLTIGVLGIQGALKTSATLAITGPAVMMTLPMFDVVAAMVRRRLTGRRFDDADRLHIHHRLLDRGWTPWQVLCLIGAICLTMGAAATAATVFRRDALAWIAAMTLVVLMIRLRLFGHDEFALAKRAIGCSLEVVCGVGGPPGASDATPRFGKRSRLTGCDWASNPDPDADFGLQSLHVAPRPVGPVAPQCFAVEYSSGGVLFAARPSVPANPLDRPGHAGGRACCWSLSVSLPDADGELSSFGRRARSRSPTRASFRL